MARGFLSGSNRACVLLRRLSRSISSQRAAAAGDYWSDFLRREVEDHPPLKRISAPTPGSLEEQQEKAKSVEIYHPWPEWVKLVEHLLKRGYLDRGTFQPSASTCASSSDFNQIRTACLNFARERSELIRYLSRKDIGQIVGSGCPSLDRKVVNSGKRLRAFVGTNEGEVCSSCKLRGNCERAYVKAHEEERGRTLDVMHIVLTYGFDAVNASVEGKPCLDKAIKESLRKLLNDMLKLSINEEGSISEGKRHEILTSLEKERSLIGIPMKQGDWICPKFLNFAKNIKCLRCDGAFQERLAKLRGDREHLPLKKGDWICEKCNFLNFAKNAKCLQCNEKPTNRLINPGEWECSSCNYINFRKNYFCLKCGWKRPKASCTGEEIEASHKKNKGQQNKQSDVDFPRFIQQNSLPKQEGSGNFTSHKYRFCKSDGMDGDEPLPESKRISEFGDFPILGGKSAISRDPMARKRWKEEMWCRKMGMVSEGSPVEKGNQAAAPCGFTRIVSDESGNDEDDIAGWFRK